MGTKTLVALTFVGVSAVGCDAFAGGDQELRMVQDTAPPAGSSVERLDEPTDGPREPYPAGDTASLMVLDRAQERNIQTDSGPKPIPEEPQP